MVGLVVVQHGDEAADISAVTAAQQLARNLRLVFRTICLQFELEELMYRLLVEK
jgi:hypothetical protein